MVGTGSGILLKQNLNICFVGLAVRKHTDEDTDIGVGKDRNPSSAMVTNLVNLSSMIIWKTSFMPSEL